MKKIFSLLIVAAMVTTACTKQSRGSDDAIPHQQGIEDNLNGGNTTAVPAAVLSAFNSRYPDATNVQWKQQSDGSYKAEFYRGAVKWQATFTAGGALVKEEHN